MTKFVLHPIYSLATRAWSDEEAFDLGLLPMDIGSGIRLQNVRGLLGKDAFSTWSNLLSQSEAKKLSSVQYALVRQLSSHDSNEIRSFRDQVVEPVEVAMACLRLIRPMREHLGIMRGCIRADGTYDIQSFSTPYNVFDVPESEQLSTLRTTDAVRLRQLFPKLLLATDRKLSKITMAVEFFQAGFFETNYWKSRFALRCSAIEAIFNSRKHKKSGITKKRIKSLLGTDTPLYEKGDIPSYLPQPDNITVGNVLEELYEARNCIAHGDRIPDRFFQEVWRRGVQRPLVIMAVLDEAASIIARKSILTILERDLEEHFKDSDSADAYFDSAL